MSLRLRRREFWCFLYSWRNATSTRSIEFYIKLIIIKYWHKCCELWVKIKNNSKYILRWKFKLGAVGCYKYGDTPPSLKCWMNTSRWRLKQINRCFPVCNQRSSDPQSLKHANLESENVKQTPLWGMTWKKSKISFFSVLV